MNPIRKSEIQERHQAIHDLLETELVQDQEGLVALLSSKYGIETTQAAVSRDCKKLGIIKKTEKGVRVYANPDRDATSQLLELGVVEISHNETTIAVHTLPGLADFIGDHIDASDVEVLGCIAGENTVMVWPKSIKNIGTTTKQLAKLLKYKHPGK
jgi:transcriptional regulator of arginine metabolism